ncbi:MAG: hypothetical protein QM767_13430 [Anaeromyxobacter sp.]
MEQEQHLVIAQLRDAIRKIEHRPARRDGYVPSGVPEVDGALPGGGFPRGALSELTGGPASGKTGVALRLLAGLPPDALAAWVDARGELYPPAAEAMGVDLARLLIVRPWFDSGAAAGPAPTTDGRRTASEAPGPARALWAAEALLASGAFAAVVIDAPQAEVARGWDAAARRLQAAAEKGGAVGVWLSRPGGRLRVPAAARVELGPERRLGHLVPVASRRAGHAA